MTSVDFWQSIEQIAEGGFTSNGLQILDSYAEQFIRNRILYKRFSPNEQHGCSKGGHTHVIASLLTGAKVATNPHYFKLNDFKSQREFAAQQIEIIKSWAKATNLWYDNIDITIPQLLGAQIAEGGEAIVYDNGPSIVKTIGLDYFIEPILALDRITLHNAFFPETRLFVLGFGCDSENNFYIIVEQPFIQGYVMDNTDIDSFIKNLGFNLINPRNWTYATPEIYLSDLHDENVIRSNKGSVFVIDCDIRINIPALKCGGIRCYNTEIEIIENN